MKGYLDRVEDNNMAVILIEEENEEIVVPIDELPDGSKEKTWLQMEHVQGLYKVISIDHETTAEKAQQTSALMEKLRKRKKGSKFKK